MHSQVELLAARADQDRVEYVHQCLFCGWRRPARSGVVLTPRCAVCGCTLTGVARDALGTAAGERRQLAKRESRAAKSVATLVAAALVLIAGRAGYLAGGLLIAITAAAAMVFLLLPFTRRSSPQRSQPASRRTVSGENAGRQTEM